MENGKLKNLFCPLSSVLCFLTSSFSKKETSLYCNFCGKNFDSKEGFEEVNRAGHHMVRCDKCTYHGEEREFDWRMEMYGSKGAVSTGRSGQAKSSRK